MKVCLRSTYLFAAALACAVACSLALRVTTPPSVRAAEDASSPMFYTQHVLLIFQANCYRCHGDLNHRGGLNMNTREALLKGGHHGPALVPGDPSKSLLVTLIRHQGPADDPMNMPPAPHPKLSDAEIAVVEAWIKAGAITPTTAAGK